LGSIIKPFRLYISNRTKGNFYKTIQKWNNYIEQKDIHKLNKDELNLFVSCINSYLGIVRHFACYKLRKQILIKNFSLFLWQYVYVIGNKKIKSKLLVQLC